MCVWSHYGKTTCSLTCSFFISSFLDSDRGYVRAMHYFDNLIISVASLMEPVVAELMAVIFGVGFLPGWKGWLGNALVAFGTLAVVYHPPGKRPAGSIIIRQVYRMVIYGWYKGEKR
jgi:hypothetical protein